MKTNNTGSGVLTEKALGILALTMLVCFTVTGCGDKNKVDETGAGKPMHRASADDANVPSLANPKPAGQSGK
ncbi:MAG: hypothetical protein ABJA67_05350 [Chthonomonadales bacterium]